jgi:hypothetical protein
LAGIKEHDAAAVVLQGVESMLESQLAFAHSAHAREIRLAPLRSQKLRQALEFSGSAYKAVRAGAAVGEVVGGVGFGEFGFGWGWQVRVVLAADELITANSEGAARNHWAVGAVGLVPRGWRRVGWLAASAD